ncbi:MAG: RIP metalloprotease RseP [Endomicrobiales bacterium]|nr:RIP metalloprotease RseP [Endomicrobiales bacterium]
MINIFGYQITVLQIIFTVFSAGILVFIHELGHFIMAKKFKLKVEKFAFGFGPEIVGFTKNETRYSICAIPLGGMVKLPGEDIDSSTGSPDEFYSQEWYKRLSIAFFGPFMNYVLAVLIFVFVIYTWGLAKPSNMPVIGETVAGYPAEKAGLKAGDKITKINNVEIKDWLQIAGYIHNHPEEELNIKVLRDDEQVLEFAISPKIDKAQGVGLIGIAPLTENEPVGFISAFDISVRMVVFQSVFTLEYLWKKLINWEKPDVAGPVGVIKYLAKAAKSGLQDLLHLLGVISVALGLFNLLPIPILDGGHIFLALIEGIFRRPLNKKVIQTANLIGLTIIIFIFIIATYNDFTR